MSDTASSSVNTTLTPTTGVSSVFKPGDPVLCMMYGMKFFVYLGIIICLTCLFMSCLSSSLDRSMSADTVYYQETPIRYPKHSGHANKPCNKCERCRLMAQYAYLQSLAKKADAEQQQAQAEGGKKEEFQNTMSTFQTYGGSNFQSIPLTGPDGTDSDPGNLVFGQANRSIRQIDDFVNVIIDINANLYVLDGNVFDQNKDAKTQSYKAYLTDDRNSQILLGELKRYNDGLYKLKYTTNNATEVTEHRNLIITYERNGDKSVLLSGRFAL